VTDATTRRSSRRLAFWCVFVAVIAALNYSARFTESAKSRAAEHSSLYSWTTFGGGMIVYAVWLGIVLLICIDRFELLAFRRPQSWGRALGLAVAALVAIWVWGVIASHIPLPQSPGHEQGIVNVNWEPKHAAAFAANAFLFAIVAPFVEELTFRGAGQSLLLGFVGRVPSMLLVGIAFGLTHGLLEALIVLIPFGVVLAWLRDRTDSVVPGMFVHALFNGAALAAVFAS
jgi:membrane protease YdiL (CAAX protease family)